MKLGSPPPVWGTQLVLAVGKHEHRITPTCVGNTWSIANRQKKQEDHPHLCGEHRKSIVFLSENPGSPPPVWGTQKTCSLFCSYFGITPTCVGNTRLASPG